MSAEAFVRHHALDNIHEPFFSIGGFPLLTKFSAMVLLSGLVLLFVARKAVAGRGTVATGVLQNAFEGLVCFIRDEMLRPTMGHHGDKFLPFFCTIFSLILTTNLLGMIPIPVIGGTATSNLGMTGVLAASVLCVSIGGGIKAHGIGGFLHTFVPPGLPLVLVPVLFVLELGGFFIKHAVLAIRLFANMMVGHFVIGAFLSMIFAAKISSGAATAYAVSVPAVALAVFFDALELLFCFLQAYVFTLLSVLFVGGTVHPEH